MSLNQAPPLVDYDPLAADPTLDAALLREGAGPHREEVAEFGRRVVSAEVTEWGVQANEFPPRLRTHDRFGDRIDQVDFHPAWHHLMRTSIEAGLHALPFERPAGEGGRVTRDAKFALMAQIEAGHGCPVSMTTAVNYALVAAGFTTTWTDRILTRRYDPRFLRPTEKTGVIMGMGMTEVQGGSDVRSNLSTATPVNDGHLINGDKWFMSAPQADGFLVLAQAAGGLTCYLMPRVLPDGTINGIRIQRLKDKLGNRSNASSEVEFHDAWAEQVGEEGRGVSTIIEMVNGTRLDCAVGSMGLMRQAVTQAGWHVHHRHAFGGPVIEKPLMQNVVADLELETEVATMLTMRLSGAFDRADLDPDEAAFKRVATPILKYWVTKRCSEVVREAMECLGGNGYVEESNLPRLYRESPVNAIWEGSGNVIALDLLRAVRREPGGLEAVTRELVTEEPVIAKGVAEVQAMLTEDPESNARRITETLAELLGASLLIRHGDPAAQALYLGSRLGNRSGRLFGTLPAGPHIETLARRAVPSPG